MRKLILAGIASLGLVVAPAHADDAELETKTYDLSAMGFTLSGAVNVGGTIFAIPGLPVTRVTGADATGTPILLQAAQDPDGDGFSGGAGEASALGCGEVDLTSSEVPFDPSLEIAVFVSTVGYDLNALELACPDGIATTGTVTLYGVI